MGRASEAVAQHRRALEEDPLNLVLRAGLAISLTSAGKDEEALAEARKILELDPNFVSACTLQTFERDQSAPAGGFGVRGKRV